MRLRHCLTAGVFALASCHDTELTTPEPRQVAASPAALLAGTEKVGVVTASLTQLDDATVSQLTSMMNHANITWVRELLNWSQIQPYALHQWDEGLRQDYHRVFGALRAANIKIFVTLQATPPYACTSGSGCDIFQAPDPAQWTEFVRDVVSEFWEVDYWGVYNEPGDIGQWHAAAGAPYYGNHYEAYKQTVRAAATAIHVRRIEGEWTKKVVAYEQGPGPWLLPLVGEIGNDIDVIALHYYAHSWNTLTSISDVDAQLRSVRPQGWPLWIGEVNLPTPDPDDNMQARNAVKVYQAQDQTSIENWQKTFYFHFWAEPSHVNTFSMVSGARSGSPSPRLNLSCLARLTRGQPLDPSCTATSECAPYHLSRYAECRTNPEYTATISPEPFCSFSAGSNGFPATRYTWTFSSSGAPDRTVGSTQTIRMANEGAGQLIVVMEDALVRRIATYRDIGNCTPAPYFIADHPWTLISEYNIHGGLQFGRVYWQDEVWMEGTQYGHALGMHAPSSGVGVAEFQIPAGARYFRSMFGYARQDGTDCQGYDLGRVLVDGQVVWSEAITGRTLSTVVDTGLIPLPAGARVLRLEVDALGSNHCAHTTWGDPHFT